MNIDDFREEQLQTSRKVLVRDDFKKIELVAGCDQAFKGKKVISAIVVCTKDLKVVDEQYATVETDLPYLPGFRYYREGPAIAAAFAKLKKAPDVMIMSANGILHPLRMGLASQVGIALNVPTIGIAKTLLCGNVEEGKVYLNNEVRGQEIKTREHSKPLYVSAGHRISLETSLELIKEITKYPHKLPEPLHLAHRLAKKALSELYSSEKGL
ncbi:endonuclease V [Candidatus Woesearchaeota archaeon]|nr:endonuclease V [Candidatus Woesearchaeota archaeon]